MNKKKWYTSWWAITIFSIVIFLNIINLIIPDSILYEQPVGIPRECVETTNNILSCDGLGIDNESECRITCLEETGLNETRFVRNMQVDSQALGTVKFNGCYCYEVNGDLNRFYVIPN